MSNPGSLWYTARRPDGTWHGGFGRVGSEEANGPGQFTALGCGAVGTELHVVAVAKFTEVWHTTRDAGGSWEPSFAFVGSDFQEGFPAIDCATVFPELHVVVVHGISGGGLWHTVRHADGSWQPGFAVVGGLFRRVACAGVGDALHVAGIADDGRLRHTVRFADGAWQPEFDLIPDQGPITWRFISVACSGVGDRLHVVGVAGGRLWHTVRRADGSSRRGFGLVEVEDPDHSSAFTSVGCAGVGDQLHVGVIDARGDLRHTIRSADGTWQPAVGS